MSPNNPIKDVKKKGVAEELGDAITNNMSEKAAPFTDAIHDEKETEFAADINHVVQLGFNNAAELEKKVVRALDTWMLPQLWILYMFNYLNRTNVAQARLNTFDEDLNLGEGDYQVCISCCLHLIERIPPCTP